MNTQGSPSGDSSSPGPRPADVPPEADAESARGSSGDAQHDPQIASPGDARHDPQVGGPGDASQDQPSAGPGIAVPPPSHTRSGHVGPYTTNPADPILPFVAPPVPRRRRSDWPVLAVALTVSALIMAACCIAGFAFYFRNGG
jgi:hypothetical protein